MSTKPITNEPTQQSDISAAYLQSTRVLKNTTNSPEYIQIRPVFPNRTDCKYFQFTFLHVTALAGAVCVRIMVVDSRECFIGGKK
jgi:hypothetical protein